MAEDFRPGPFFGMTSAAGVGVVGDDLEQLRRLLRPLRWFRKPVPVGPGDQQASLRPGESDVGDPPLLDVVLVTEELLALVGIVGKAHLGCVEA